MAPTLRRKGGGVKHLPDEYSGLTLVLNSEKVLLS